MCPELSTFSSCSVISLIQNVLQLYLYLQLFLCVDADRFRPEYYVYIYTVVTDCNFNESLCMMRKSENPFSMLHHKVSQIKMWQKMLAK